MFKISKQEIEVDGKKIILETASTSISERGETRLDDQVSEASMEQRKKEGYF